MPRDPQRIDEILNRIKRLWLCYPDLRLGQLMTNAVTPDHDLFYVEDEALVAFIEDYQKKLSGRV